MTGGGLAVEFLGGPTDRWHRWTVVQVVSDAAAVGAMLLTEKGVHAIAVRSVDAAPAPDWMVRS